jgi:hypothetical protein
MELRIKFGNASIVFDVNQYDHAGEIDTDSFGGGYASVRCRDWLRVYKRNEFTLYMWDVHDVENLFRDNPDAEIALESDDFIVFLDAVSREPRRKYNWSWNGLAYWLCHDVTHAKHDVYGGGVEVNSNSEDRTLYEGAILARKHGTSLEQIVRELVRAEAAYESRFGTPTQALDRFLHEIEKQEPVLN